MHTIQLEGTDLEEMSQTDMLSTNGGNPVWLAGALVALAISAINNFGDIRQGFSDGNSGKPPRY